ncbi:MAG: helix-turn-helix transcriptional regulator [Candidatus Cryptobacteroides sp.]
MPIDKNKLIRFQALDRCFSDQARKYYIEDLKKACIQALANAGSAAKSISRSTLYSDINEMTTNAEWPGANLIDKSESTERRRRYFRYKDPKFSIWKRDLDDCQLAQLRSIMLMLRQFKDFPQADAIEDIIRQFEKQYKFKLGDAEEVIAFESNENLEALSLVGILFSYISHKNVLKIVYEPFNRPPMTYEVHPHFLRQHSRRWFLIGLSINEYGKKNRSVFSLDRIKSIEQIPGEYIPSDKDMEEIFYDQIGVTLTKCDPVVVKLQFTRHRYRYVITKPLHPSQKIVSEEARIISIEVRPNKELYQALLAFGDDVTVLEPEIVVTELSEKIRKMNDLYGGPE